MHVTSRGLTAEDVANLVDSSPASMFSLLYGFFEYITKKEELRILMLGLDKAGMTACLCQTACVVSTIMIGCSLSVQVSTSVVDRQSYPLQARRRYWSASKQYSQTSLAWTQTKYCPQ